MKRLLLFAITLAVPVFGQYQANTPMKSGNVTVTMDENYKVPECPKCFRICVATTDMETAAFKIVAGMDYSVGGRVITNTHVLENPLSPLAFLFGRTTCTLAFGSITEIRSLTVEELKPAVVNRF